MKYFVIIFTLLFVFYSCTEDEVILTPELNSTQASQDNLIAESIFNDVLRIVEYGISNNKKGNQYPKFTMLNNDTSNIDTLLINFGNTNYLYNNKLRKGIINVTFSGNYRDSLSVITTTFDNFYINNKLIQGEMIVTNNGKNNSQNLFYNIDVNNASINTENGIINWQSNRIRELIAGGETYLDYSDDIYRITGISTGNAANGNDFSVEIIDPLHMDLSCLAYCVITSGSSKISPDSYPTRTIYYGDSTCNCNIDVVTDEETYPLVIEY